jgi:hypothetical protein
MKKPGDMLRAFVGLILCRGSMLMGSRLGGAAGLGRSRAAGGWFLGCERAVFATAQRETGGDEGEGDECFHGVWIGNDADIDMKKPGGAASGLRG